MTATSRTALAFGLAFAAAHLASTGGAAGQGDAAPDAPDRQDLADLANRAFDRWDLDGNGRIEGREFVAGLQRAWANDGRVDRQAFNEGWAFWFAGVPRPDFETLDQDGDGLLSGGELGGGLAYAPLQDIWPGSGDGRLTPAEFHAGLANVIAPEGGAVDRDRYTVIAIAVGVAPGVDQGLRATTGDVVIDPGTVTEPGAQSDFGTGSLGADRADTVEVGRIVALDRFRVDQIYPDAMSAEAFLDETKVYGADGEEIGEAKDLIIDSDGNVVSMIAEVGGLWGIGESSVSIPWTEVVPRPGGGVLVPVTEDTVDDYGLFAGQQPTARTLSENVASDVEDEALGPRAWRVSELVGDYARLKRAAGYKDYGLVSDVLIRDGKVVAAVVNPDYAYGIRGPFAYPYYGYGYGWTPGSRYYDLPYSEDEVRRQQRLDYGRLGRD